MVKDCRNREGYPRERYRRNRANYLEGKCCVKCGGTENLEIDHIDPSTKKRKGKQNNCNMFMWSIAEREEELEKCQVLCHDCHLEKTLLENKSKRKNIQHGSKTMYSNYGCRCDLCRDWQHLKSIKDSERKYLKKGLIYIYTGVRNKNHKNKTIINIADLSI